MLALVYIRWYFFLQLHNEIGQCQPLWNMYNSIIKISLCQYIVDAFVSRRHVFYISFKSYWLINLFWLNVLFTGIILFLNTSLCNYIFFMVLLCFCELSFFFQKIYICKKYVHAVNKIILFFLQLLWNHVIIKSHGRVTVSWRFRLACGRMCVRIRGDRPKWLKRDLASPTAL